MPCTIPTRALVLTVQGTSGTWTPNFSRPISEPLPSVHTFAIPHTRDEGSSSCSSPRRTRRIEPVAAVKIQAAMRSYSSQDTRSTCKAQPSRPAAGCAQQTALFLTHKLDETMPAKRGEKACLRSFDRSLPFWLCLRGLTGSLLVQRYLDRLHVGNVCGYGTRARVLRTGAKR